jgi:hypothetical protein
MTVLWELQKNMATTRNLYVLVMIYIHSQESLKKEDGDIAILGSTDGFIIQTVTILFYIQCWLMWNTNTKL